MKDIISDDEQMASLGRALINMGKYMQHNKNLSVRDTLLNVGVKSGMKRTTMKKAGMAVSKKAYVDAMVAGEKEVHERNVGGRPAVPTIDVEQLKIMVQSYSKKSCRFYADGDTVQTLQGSIRRSYLQSDELQEMVSLRHLCRLMQ